MKNIITRLIIIFILFTSNIVYSNGYYIKPGVGHNDISEVDYSTSSTVINFDAVGFLKEDHFWSIALGIKKDYIRFEIETSTSKNDIDGVEAVIGESVIQEDFSGTLGFNNIIFNAYYDLALTDVVSLYAGLGIGGAELIVDGKDQYGFDFNDSNIGLSYQISTGVQVVINDWLTIDLGYKLFFLENVNLERYVEDIKYSYETDYVADIYNGSIIIFF